MADEAAGDLETVPGLIAIAFYIIGTAIVSFGLLKLKHHVDHPQQTTFGSWVGCCYTPVRGCRRYRP